MNSKIFGPCAWTVLQLMTFVRSRKNTQVQLTESERENVSVVVYSMAMILPCKYCRESYRRYIQCIDVRSWIQNNDFLHTDSLNYWFYLIHNLVNQKLGKVWERDFEKVYPTSVELETYRDCVFQWLLFLTMNYQTPTYTEEMEHALRKVSQEAQKNHALFIRSANEKNVTLGSFLDKIVFDKIYYEYKLDKTDANVKKCDWRKTCWYIYFVAHLCHFLLPSFDQNNSNWLQDIYTMWVKECHRTFLDQDELFNNVFLIKKKWDPECGSLQEWKDTFRSYRSS